MNNSITPEEFRIACLRIKDDLATRTINSISSITRLETSGMGYAHGTGTYVKLDDEIYLLTNDHVVSDAIAIDSLLGHIPGPTDEYKPLLDFTGSKWPIDIALSKQTSTWEGATKKPLSGLFDERWAPVPDEVLFLIGFPGSKAERSEEISPFNIRMVHFDVLSSPAIPFLLQAAKKDISHVENFDPRYHFALNFPDEGNIAGLPLPRKFPNPGGLSGSLVWNTKFVESAMSGIEWHAGLARICGTIWADVPKEKVLLGTKIEYVSPEIKKLHLGYDDLVGKFRKQNGLT